MTRDPYFAGRPPVESADEPNPMIVGWVFVYALNLLVPLFLAMLVTSRAGRFGMTIAIFLVLGLGCWIVPRIGKAGRALLVGGGFTALLQFFPPLPMIAGSMGVAVARGMGQTLGHEQIGSESGGFVATVVTGGILIVVALGAGWILRGASSWFQELRVVGKPAKKPGDKSQLH